MRLFHSFSRLGLLCLMLGLHSRCAAEESPRFAGLWIKDSSVAWVARHGLTSAQYQAAFTEFTSQGYRPISVSGYGINGVPYFVAVWDKSSGPAYAARHGLNAAQYQTTFDQLTGQGYRPIQVRGYTVAGTDYYAGIWIKDSTVTWAARHRLTAAAYQTAFTQFANQGYRLLDVSGYIFNGTAYFTGIWIKQAGPSWVAHHEMSASSYQTLFTQYASEGYRLRTVCGYTVGGLERYVAIWDKGTGPVWAGRHGLSGAQYQTAVTDLSAQGYRPIEVSGYAFGSDDTPVPNIPSSGVPVPNLSAFDDAMKRYMGARNVPAAVLCVSKNGKILLEHAYGWQDRAKSLPLKPSALFRIASLSKPPTAAAVRKLVTDGKLKLTDFAFNLGQPVPGILKIVPFGTPDVRLKQVTVAHLLDHKAGWDRDISGDPMFQANQIATALKVPNPPSQEDFVRFTLGKPLDHAPGSTYAYSNFGYLVLGLIIEKVSGRDYVDYLHLSLLRPLGSLDADLELGRSLPNLRNEREPWYSDPATGVSVFSPPSILPFPDGAFYLEAMESHGGLISSVRAYCRFLKGYWISGHPRAGNGQSWTFFGSLPGTWSMAHQRADGVDLVAFFNQRTDPSGLSYDDILPLLNGVADSIADWPTVDVTQLVPVAPRIELRVPTQSLAFQTETGRVYQLQWTLDFEIWGDQGSHQIGNGRSMTVQVDLGKSRAPGPRLYRLVVE